MTQHAHKCGTHRRSEIGRSHTCAVQTDRVEGRADGRHKTTGTAVEAGNIFHRVIVAPSIWHLDGEATYSWQMTTCAEARVPTRDE